MGGDGADGAGPSADRDLAVRACAGPAGRGVTPAPRVGRRHLVRGRTAGALRTLRDVPDAGIDADPVALEETLVDLERIPVRLRGVVDREGTLRGIGRALHVLDVDDLPLLVG